MSDTRRNRGLKLLKHLIVGDRALSHAQWYLDQLEDRDDGNPSYHHHFCQALSYESELSAIWWNSRDANKQRKARELLNRIASLQGESVESN